MMDCTDKHDRYFLRLISKNVMLYTEMIVANAIIRGDKDFLLRFNLLENWKAFRLGSPSVALPDVLVVNNIESTIFTIEAKSGTGTTLQVPFDQIERCLLWTNNFQVYKKREVILAFKFLSKKRIGSSIYENRKLHEFYKVWNKKRNPVDCVCTYDGKIYALINGEHRNLDLKDYIMPFKSKNQFSRK